MPLKKAPGRYIEVKRGAKVSLARHAIFSLQRSSELKVARSPKTHKGQKCERLNFMKKRKKMELEESSIRSSHIW